MTKMTKFDKILQIFYNIFEYLTNLWITDNIYEHRAKIDKNRKKLMQIDKDWQPANKINKNGYPYKSSFQMFILTSVSTLAI